MKAKEGHRYYEKRTRLETVIPLKTPFIIFLDPSSACNLRCQFCPCGRAHDDLWTEEKKRSVGFLPMDLFRKIVDDCADFPDKIKVLRLYKEGEPLLNPHFAEMVAYAKQSGHFLGVDTTSNGTLLQPKLNRDIVKAGLDRINISIEGLNSKEYEEVSGVQLDFDELCNNIRDLYEHKGQCHIFIKTIVDYYEGSATDARRQKFYDLFGDICDEISFEYTSPCWPGFGQEGLGEKGIYGNKIERHLICPRIFYILTINSDGTASECHVDWNRQLVIGDARKETVTELWKKLDVHRIAHLKGNRDKMPGCSVCLEPDAAAMDNIDSYREELLRKFLEDSK